MYPVLRQRNFALLWAGGFVSAGGDWLLELALPFYVYQQTESVIASTALFMIHILPQVLLGSVAGVFVDRWDRRATMLISDLTRALLILLLLPVAFANDWLWLSYPIVALEATVSQFFGPAKNSLLPHLVGEDDLMSANSLFSVSDSVLRLIGPALGGALLGLFGLASVVMVDSGSYLFSALMIGLLQVPKSAVVAGAGTAMEGAASRWVRFWRDWLGGLHYVRKDHLLRSILVITSIASVAAGVVNPLLQVFVQDELHAGAAVLGLMLSATGVGTLFTGLVLARARADWPLGRLASLGQLLFGGMLFVTFLSRSAPVVILLSAPVGVAIASSIGFRTLLQAGAEDQYRGRVLGAASATGALQRLIGEGVGSLLVAPVGLIPVLDAACGLYILAGLVGLLLLPPSTDVVPAEVE